MNDIKRLVSQHRRLIGLTMVLFLTLGVWLSPKAMADIGDVMALLNNAGTQVFQLDQSGNLTITGTLTAAGSSSSAQVTNSTTGGNALALTGAPVNTATLSLFRLGGAIASGNTASNGGTYIGLNQPNSGAGSAADLLNLQHNGTSELKLTSAGVLTLGTPLAASQIDPATVQVATFNLSSANILGMNATPVTVLAAPGASKTLYIDQIALALTTTSTQYASGGAVQFQYHGQSTNVMAATIAAGVINASAGTSLTVLDAASSVTGISNTGIDITNATGAFTTGTGTGILYIRYRVLPY